MNFTSVVRDGPFAVFLSGKEELKIELDIDPLHLDTMQPNTSLVSSLKQAVFIDLVFSKHRYS